MNKNWWKPVQNPHLDSHGSYGTLIAGQRLLHNSLTGNRDFVVSRTGRGSVDKIRRALHPSLKLVRSTHYRLSSEYHYAYECGYLSLTKSGEVSVYLVTDDEDVAQHTIELCDRLLKSQSGCNRVYAITTSASGLTLRSLGLVKSPIQLNNYAPRVRDDYTHVISCLNGNDPCGRLAILEGSPGTGKSYMIRGLINDVNATFVLVGASLVGTITGPEVLPVLLEAREDNDDRPVVLILEDADQSLVKRQGSNTQSLSDVLNLGDGLLGELVDVRVIATTNAQRIDMDDAVTRPGRLCRHIKFEPLSLVESQLLYTKLVGSDSKMIRKPTTLAEIYRLARQDGWEPVSTKTYRPGNYQ